MADDGPVKLRRSYSERVLVLLFGMLLLAGAVSLPYEAATKGAGWVAWLFCGAVALFGLAMGGRLVWQAVLPLRVDVDSQGWSIRTPRLNRDLRWDEIAAVVLADASAAQRPRATAGPRLLLVPGAGVNLGVPLTEENPVDGRAALELFQLDEVDYNEARLTRELSALAGERFHNLCRQLTQPTRAMPLRRFPDGPDHARLMRWLDRQKALRFAGWYLFVLVPPLLLVGLAARYNELLGIVVLVAAAVVIVAGTEKIWVASGDCRGLADEEAAIDGADLVNGTVGVHRRTNLHSGSVNVLRPGLLKGFGRAWLLASPGHQGHQVADLLLSDPRTGQLRSEEDLRALAAVLGASSQESDRTAGRQLEELAAQAPRSAMLSSTVESDDPPFSVYMYVLWLAVKGVGRAVVLLGVVLTVAMAGGMAGEGSALVRPALFIVAVCLFGVWVCYALYRTIGLLDALLRVVARALRA